MAGALTASRRFNLIAALVCVAIGVGLFLWPFAEPRFAATLPEGETGWMRPGSPVLTFLFALPLMAYAVWTHRLGIWGAVGLIVALSAIYLAAQASAIAWFVPRMPPVLEFNQPDETPAARAARHAHNQETGRQAGLEAGAIGGAVGGAASLLLMTLVFRPRSRVLPLVGVGVLAALGALGVSGLTGSPSGRPTNPGIVALGLFGPWQAVLGTLVAIMIATPRPRRKDA